MNGENGSHFLDDTKAPVRNLQRWLRALSRKKGGRGEIFIDGIYGEETRAAVSDFQRKNGLPVTGEVDLITFNGIFAAYTELMRDGETLGYAPDFDSYRDKRLALGDEHDDIYVLQALFNVIALEDERYYVKPSGVYDEGTQRSVELLRRATGRDGGEYVDRALWNDLVRLSERPQYYT